jgi:opacity protein-like surface antigen
MRRIVSWLAVLGVAAVVNASVVEAQSPIRFGIAGGLTLPTGEDKDVVDNGFHGQIMLGFGMMAMPVKLRADLSYHSFDGKDDILFGDASVRVIGGALNAIIGMGGVGVKPYLTGGLGLYNSKLEFDGGDESATDFGINGGVGLEFGLTGLSTFLEVRYINVFSEGESTGVIPITFGILF